MRPLSTLSALACMLLLCQCTASSSAGQSRHAEQAKEDAQINPPPDLDADDLERAIFYVVNRERQARGRAPLAWSDSLQTLARGHSHDMAQRAFFSHVTPGGLTPADRAARQGFPASRAIGGGMRIGVGENLFRTSRHDGYRDTYRQGKDGSRRLLRRQYDWRTQQDIAEQTVKGWLNSPSHRRALLSRDYCEQGLGVALGTQRIYVTQNLF